MSTPTISEAIGNDHMEIDRYADELKAANSLQQQTEWRNALVWLLARHAISEELTVFPAMEKHFGAEGVELTNTDRDQHQAVIEDLNKLQKTSPEAPSFFSLLDTLLRGLHNHIEHESNEDMPRLENILSRDESAELARSFERTKLITPTQSHPSAPGKPYFENVAALLAAPMDRVADLLRSFPEENEL